MFRDKADNPVFIPPKFSAYVLPEEKKITNSAYEFNPTTTGDISHHTKTEVHTKPTLIAPPKPQPKPQVSPQALPEPLPPVAASKPQLLKKGLPSKPTITIVEKSEPVIIMNDEPESYIQKNSWTILSIIATTFAIAQFFIHIPLLLGIIGVALGHISLHKMKKAKQEGKLFGILALVIGYAGLLAWIVVLICILLFGTLVAAGAALFF